jgi:antitoxin (DNA-binding transcriptional repressor) of toxin-antitoxin stability system
VQVNVHKAKTQLFKLLHGQPVAELVPAKRTFGFPFGIARQEPLAPAGNDWWQPLSGAETDDWLDGQ